MAFGSVEVVVIIVLDVEDEAVEMNVSVFMCDEDVDFSVEE